MVSIGHSSMHKPDGSTEQGWLRYRCGHRGADAIGIVVAWIDDERWLRCPSCARASSSSRGVVSPGILAGPPIDGLPADVAGAYEEARRCHSVGAFTAVELVCRKLLMHVGVDKGAKEGQTFVHYLDHLDKVGYVTPPMRPWVRLIKDHGNEATHELDATDGARAEGTLMFTAELLRLTYEMTSLAARYAPVPPAATTEADST